jgi:hypothetical protein
MEKWAGQKPEKSFRGDAPKLWNKALRSIKTAKTMHEAKREIKRYCKTLSI